MSDGTHAVPQERNRAQVSESLLWVSRELGITLNDAREALERYAENTAGRDDLQRFAELLHAALGALRIAEVQGATLLVEELEVVAQGLIQGKLKPGQEVLDALLRAAMQLPAYIERLLAGGRDIPLILLPLLNDLRAVRGTPLLTESSLFVLNISEAHLPLAQRHEPSGEDLSYVSRRLRPHFQSALLGWLRGESAENNLATMSVVADNLHAAASVVPVFQLWWVTGAVLEALLDGGLEQSASIKRLLGQSERQLKRLMDEGEQVFERDPPLELLSNLLYYVARARTRGRRVEAVHTAFRLGDFLPAEEQVVAAREGLMAPSTGLMRTVASAIKQDLGSVKDVLDIHVRTGATDVTALTPQVDHLKKVADTMRVLGLNDLSQEVRAQRDALASFLERGGARSEGALLSIASAVLAIEDRVDGELLELVNARDEPPTRTPVKEREFQHVSQAVMRESKVNLARMKEIVSQYAVKPEDKRDIDALPALLSGIGAGLLMLEKERALNLIERIARYVQACIVNAAEPPGTFDLEQLADAIVAVEYYIETLQIGRSDPWYMLDNAEACLASLEESVPATAEPLAESAPPPSVAPTPAETAEPVAMRVRETIDPELLELFIEEAKEEIASVQDALPAWRESPEQRDHVIALRRSFHTLKGSGRMVGAQLIGELAWSVENLLNRIINRTLPQTAAVLDLVAEAAEALPQLVAQLETGESPQVKVSELIDRANAVIEGGRRPLMTRAAGVAELERTVVLPRSPGDAPPVVTPESASAEGDFERTQVTPPWHATEEPAPAQESAEPAHAEHAESAEAPPAAPVEEPVLVRIFRDEAATHLAAIHAEIESSIVEPPPHPVSERLFRAWHTLAGSARTAGIDPVARLAEPLCRYAEHALGAGIAPEALTTMADSASLIGEILAGEELSDALLLSMLASIAALPPIVVEAAPEATVVLDLAPPAPSLETLLEAAESDDAPAPNIVESDDHAFVDLSFGQEPEDAVAFEAAGPAIFESVEPPQTEELAGAAAIEDFELAPAAETTEFAVEAEAQPEQLAAEPEDEYDADIAQIFAEEAAELLETAQSALATWRDAPSDREPLHALQRVLHTLKGGARMAGLARVGTVSHDLESLLTDVAANRVAPGDDVLALVQQTIDRMHEVRDSVSRAQPIGPLRSLIERIRAVARPEVLTLEDPGEPARPVDAPPLVEEAAPVVDFAEFVTPDEEMAPESTTSETVTEVAGVEPSAIEPDWSLPFTEAPAAEAPSTIEGASAEEPPLIEPPLAPPVVEAPAAPIAFEPLEPRPSAPVAPPPFEPIAPRPAQPASGWTQLTQPEHPAEPPARGRREVARVDAVLLESLLNNAGEISIFRARLEQQFSSIEFNLGELSQTVTRLREQLRKLELETEAQIRFRHQEEDARHQGFDPLELDRYSAIQQLSRALAESVSDLISIQELMGDVAQESQGLLVQQARVTTEVQDGLMRTRMVPFSQHAQRLARIVRQTALESGKLAELRIDGGSGELDRQVLERMLPPFEHMLRNAVVHGIEPLDVRRAAGKPEVATIAIQLRREGSQVVIDVADDGAGLDVATIKQKAQSLGMLDPTATLTDGDALRLILQPGFSTASRVTQAAGRGVGMDVVANEVRQLGGSLDVRSERGIGTRFTIRLPFTLAITQALLVRSAEELYAIPLPSVEGIVRIPARELHGYFEADAPPFVYGGQSYRFKHLGALLGTAPAHIADSGSPVPVILVRAGEHSSALVTDEMLGSREVVVKSVGPQIAAVRGVSGATILGDGSIAIILDISALVRGEAPMRFDEGAVHARGDERPLALVVDDSITVRRVTQRLLERHNLRVATAKDGVDAIAAMQEEVPDVLVLDIEMPRMDGYEVVSYVRNDDRLAHIPIVMVTSRVGQKHRAHGLALGVNEYLGKPYQEKDLLGAIERFLAARERGVRRG